MKNLIIISIVALFIQGCTTAYQRSGFSGGYSETQLDENVFKVSFRGRKSLRFHIAAKCGAILRQRL